MGDFIHRNQNRFDQLDDEYEKLKDELNESKVVCKINGKRPYSALNNKGSINRDKTQSQLFSDVQLNHRRIFSKNSAALAVVTLDGRFIDCNDRFESMTGFQRDDLLQCDSSFSLFHLLSDPESVKTVCIGMRKLIQGKLKDEESDTKKNESIVSGTTFSSVIDFEVNGFWRGIISS